MNCLECTKKDCDNDSPATEQERKMSRDLDKDCNRITGVDMTRYIHNRIDKEEYVKLRNREYDRRRERTPKRKEQKRNQYVRHKKEKLAYQKSYYARHREEIIARQMAYYEAHKEEINAKNRERYYKKKGVISES